MTLSRGTLLSILVALVCATLLSLWIWRIENAVLHDRLDVVAREHGEALDNRIASLRLAPRLLADDPRLIAALLDPSAATAANRLLARVRQETGLAFVFLMSRSGMTVAASNYADEVSFVGQNYGFRPYFRGAVNGNESHHFAVGATTGRPGYFIAVPVFRSVAHETPIGVVVGKLELDELITSWQSRQEHALVYDSRGVSILSTRDDLLYLTSRPLDGATRRRIRSERPYQPSDTASLELFPGPVPRDATRIERITRDGDTDAYLSSGVLLDSENWTVTALTPQRSLWFAVLRDMLILLGIATIVSLLLRVVAQRRRMAQVRATQAQELERLVDVRTRELESAQRALIARSNFEMLGRMSAAINHEVNQPLASLRLDLASARTLLTRKAPDIDAISEVVIDADRTTKRIGRVIETLRRVAGPPARLGERIEPARMLADLRDTIQRERPVVSKALVVDDVPPDTGFVLGNAVLLQQALLNLVYNAFDAIEDVVDPRVHISCHAIDELNEQGHAQLAIDVNDNGPGVAPELVEHLYEPFARAPGAVSGLGLGLALAQEIAGRHDGRIVYRALQPGSQFALQLPAATEADLASRPFMPPEESDP